MKRNNESGVALLSALLVMMLVSGLLVGFVAAVSTDQFTGLTHRTQTHAVSAAHAGLEKLTGDLGQLFLDNFNPTEAQINALTTPEKMPVIPGVSYQTPSGESGYRISFRDENDDGLPDLENENGTQLTAGDYRGLTGLITPYDIEVTARVGTRGEVRMRRTMQTVAIPVFQFGIFSENSQSFFAGPDFYFGGRVHTNQHLFLKQDGTNTLTLGAPVTAVGEIVRTHLANGRTSHNGYVRMAKAKGCPPPPAAAEVVAALCEDIASTEGSVVGDENSEPNPNWLAVVTSTNEWLKKGRKLELPIVTDENATAFDLIKRPPTDEDPDTNLGKQRFHNLGTLRILLSDEEDDLINASGAVRTASGAKKSPIRLKDTFVITSGNTTPQGLGVGTHHFATSNGDAVQGFRTVSGTPSLDGWILINRQDRNGEWTDVTYEILSLGFTGRRISNGSLDTADMTNLCNDYHLNAVIKLQRVGDEPGNATTCPTSGLGTHDFWPNVLYDAREGMLRDDQHNRAGSSRIWFGGVMHYVELDVRNLKRWLYGEIGSSNSSTCKDGGSPGTLTCPMDVTGYVVYFSDRRNNRDFGDIAGPEWVNNSTYTVANGWNYSDDRETGEFGFEDNINPGHMHSLPNGSLDGEFTDAQGNTRWAEDINQDGVLQEYGGRARLPIGQMLPTTLAPEWNASNINDSIARYTLYGTDGVFGTSVPRNVGRVNRAFFFRRALKLVNGGKGNLPANQKQGLTVASENPVYIQGNYNACTDVKPTSSNDFNPPCDGNVGFGTQPGVDHVSAAVIADAVTVLSNAWNDIRSFRAPHNSEDEGLTSQTTRQAAPTYYRLGIIGGKGLNFQRPGSNTAADHNDFGTDGGAHNFIRYIENWNTTPKQKLHYLGSLISLYTSRQAVGIYKCCEIVYDAPDRQYRFDEDFLTPGWLPPRTPMFRDLNTLTFRQILRPTQ